MCAAGSRSRSRPLPRSDAPEPRRPSAPRPRAPRFDAASRDAIRAVRERKRGGLTATAWSDQTEPSLRHPREGGGPEQPRVARPGFPLARRAAGENPDASHNDRGTIPSQLKAVMAGLGPWAFSPRTKFRGHPRGRNRRRRFRQRRGCPDKPGQDDPWLFGCRSGQPILIPRTALRFRENDGLT
jgi:hypothetical protein